MDNNHICSNNCLGYEGNFGGCCTLDDRGYIIGPHKEKDCYEFLDRLSKKFNREISFHEIFIEFEEGRRLFPSKPFWNDPSNYPALRIDINRNRKPCIFYNTNVKSCMVYDIRPEVCKKFYCDFLQKQTNK